MHLSGTLEAVTVDGYERILGVASRDSGSHYWVSALEPEHDIPSGELCPVWRKGQHVELTLVLRYVTAIKASSADSALGIKQPITGSPHFAVVARVMQVLELDAFTCSVGRASDEVKVDCDINHHLIVGQVVSFNAELASEA